ncbi:MAG: DUF4143 domain-containing protein [Acidobacteriota bacterium]|nr:DUF4143 domain-containing protein [Acidobacteriota bacterium]
MIKEALATFGAVVIEGARAVGKSTTAAQVAGSVVSLDSSPELVVLAQTSPGVVLTGTPPQLIDEWQLAPNLWNAIRHEVDNRGTVGQFILTGSAAPTDDITRHSGAGRFGRIRLRTMSLSESGHSTGQVDFRSLFTPGKRVAGVGGADVPLLADMIVRGGWPSTLNLTEGRASLYLRSYLDDTTRLDVGRRTDRERVRALLSALARNLSTETAIIKLGREAQLADTGDGEDAGSGTSQPTLRKYLDCLACVFVLEELPAWSTHIRSKVRQRVSPKWHFVDPSLAAAALGINAARLLAEPKTLGLFFESLAIRDLRIYADRMGGAISYYRDETGLEVDAVAELPNGKWAGFEVKLGGGQRIDEGAVNLKKLLDKLAEQRRQDCVSLNVITAGNTSYTREDGVNVIALGHLTITP